MPGLRCWAGGGFSLAAAPWLFIAGASCCRAQALGHMGFSSCGSQALEQSFRRRRWHPTPALLPGKSHGQRSLVGSSPWGREESETTEQPHFHFSLSCIGEGNGTPLQCSCLENPTDGGAWWAAVYGVAQSWTRLKPLGSSSSSSRAEFHIVL